MDTSVGTLLLPRLNYVYRKGRLVLTLGVENTYNNGITMAGYHKDRVNDSLPLVDNIACKPGQP